MTFEDNLTALATRAPQIIEQLETEEATKNALVMPLFKPWGTTYLILLKSCQSSLQTLDHAVGRK